MPTKPPKSLPFLAEASVHGGMPNDHDLREALDELANLIQAASLNATKLRRDLGERAENAIALEASLDQCVRVLERLQPTKEE